MGAEISGADALPFALPALLELVGGFAVLVTLLSEFGANLFCKRSSRSDSRRPLDCRISYPECAGSVFQAVIFAVTRTFEPPEAAGVMWTVHW